MLETMYDALYRLGNRVQSLVRVTQNDSFGHEKREKLWLFSPIPRRDELGSPENVAL
jgi:hypothetical protein